MSLGESVRRIGVEPQVFRAAEGTTPNLQLFGSISFEVLEKCTCQEATEP